MSRTSTEKPDASLVGRQLCATVAHPCGFGPSFDRGAGTGDVDRDALLSIFRGENFFVVFASRERHEGAICCFKLD